MTWWSEQASVLPRVVSGDAARLAAPAVLVTLGGLAPMAAAALPVDTLRAEQAWAEGFEAGLAEGRRSQAEADAAGSRAELERVLAALRRAADRLDEAAGTTLAVVETGVADLAFRLTQELVGREITTSEPVLDALTRGLALAPPEGDVRLVVHPADAATLAAVVERRGAGRPWGSAGGGAWHGLDRRFAVVTDDSVERGGCIVEVGPVSVDAQIGPALERVRTALGAPAEACG
ncbi:MAG: FliH/SctL family protein [Acidimicrobiales bacterium]